MTDTALPAPARSRRFPAGRPFAIAFLAGLLGILLFAAGGLYAFDRAFDGRVLPGVTIGALDLSGMDEAEARAALSGAYGDLADGEIELRSPAGVRRLTFAELGRAPDIDAMVADALAAGRVSNGLAAPLDAARTAVSGIALEPRVVYDRDRLAARIESISASLDLAPEDAWVALAEAGFELHAGRDGRSADREAPMAALAVELARPEAPERIEVEVPLMVLEPTVTTQKAEAALATAGRIVADVAIVAGDDTWTLPGATIQTWVSFATTPDGRYEPVLSTGGLEAELAGIAKDVERAPKNASFLFAKDGAIVGVSAGQNGRALDLTETGERITDLLRARAAGVEDGPVEAALREVKPALSTEEAEQSAPLMTRISTWTTWFPISEKNGNGANIWIPALDIDGYVVGPGEWFDFWNAIGPVTRARGYRDGGAIINGRTEPQGALAGGICSTSTTLFNAALRAGFQMGARRNHFYYIDRYPLGLDATVFKSGSGSVQTMSFRNDTPHPVLIRGIKIQEGSKGYVRFDLYSVPNGRTVSFSKPIVTNVQSATDTTEMTTTLAPGVRQRIEYPVGGMDVSVTRTVTGADGKQIHRDTYFSRYARITGVTLVGVASNPAPPAPAPPAPAPAPAPTPEPPPAPEPVPDGG